MANLLKRNDFGGIDRVCNYPDRDGDKLLVGQCYLLSRRTQCNANIYERLAKFEDIGYEPEVLEAMSKRNTVVEVCAWCGVENEMVWDVDVLGYEAFCPVCGKPMMLCDECTHAEDELNENADHCDWHEKADGTPQCFRCKKG